MALAEEGLIGGTCVNRGCLPTKNLLHAAERYHRYAKNSFPGLPALFWRMLPPPNALSQKLGLSQAMAAEAVEKEALNVTLKVVKGGEKRGEKR